MRNSLLHISKAWKIQRDEFYEVDPLDDSIDYDRKFNDLFCQEDLFWLTKADYSLDLGWYGEDHAGHFTLYLYRGNDWHDCELLEKRQTNNYRSIIETINQIVKYVHLGRYESIKMDKGSIDEFDRPEKLTILE